MKTVLVLLAEDDIGDLKLFEEYLKISKIIIDLHVVEKAKDIQDFLSGNHADVLMINLNLALAELKKLISEVKSLKPELPIIIITKSSNETDILKDNEVMVDYYLNGPGNGYEIIRALVEAGEFSVQVVSDKK